MKRIFLISLVLLVTSSFLVAQDPCVVCDDYDAVVGASTIGTNNNAQGGRSIILGSFSQTLSTGNFSIAIGSRVKAMAGKCVAIGSGINSDYMLTNYMQESLMVGFNSNFSTFFVGMSEGVNRTGKVGIGNVVNQEGQMEPLAKLHIRSDDGEDAVVLIEPNNWQSGETASLQLGNASYNITSENTFGLTFNSANNFLFSGGFSGFGVQQPKAKIHLNGDILFEESFNGIIMKSEDGNCWKGNLSNTGELIFTQIDCETLSSNSGISDPKHSEIFIYPNPSDGHLTIDYTGKEKTLIVEISSINGLLLSTNKIKRDENRIDISRIDDQVVILSTYTIKGALISTNKILIRK